MTTRTKADRIRILIDLLKTDGYRPTLEALASAMRICADPNCGHGEIKYDTAANASVIEPEDLHCAARSIEADHF